MSRSDRRLAETESGPNYPTDSSDLPDFSEGAHECSTAEGWKCAERDTTLLSVGEIVQRTDFGLTVLAASVKALSREPEGAFITDLSDPARFLPRRAIVFTSGLWTRTAAGVDTFLKALADADATAVVFGLLEIGSVPEEVTLRCRELDIPVVLTADDVVYSEVCEQILATLESPVQARVFREVTFVEGLAQIPANDDRVQAALDRLRDAFGLDTWLMSREGTLLSWTGREPNRRDVAAVWNLVVRFPSKTIELSSTDGRPIRAWPLDGGAGRSPAYIGVGAMDESQLPKPDSVMLMAMCMVLEAAVLERDLIGWSKRQSVKRLIDLLHEPALSPVELSARFRLEGGDPILPSVVVTGELSHPRFPAEFLLSLLDEAFAPIAVACLGSVVGRRAVIIANGVEELSTADTASVVRQVEDRRLLLAGARVRVGISDRIRNVTELGAALEQSADRMNGASASEEVAIGFTATAQTHRSLLALVDDGRLEDFVAAVLGPLSAYDKRHGLGLVQSLEAFLACNGVWLQAAAQLHIHPNTLRYRVSRIQQLSGRDLSASTDRIDFQLALAARDRWLRAGDPRAETDA